MSDISVDEFIRKNYRPVDDKPGYVWLNERGLKMISVANLAASLENYWKKMQIVNAGNCMICGKPI